MGRIHFYELHELDWFPHLLRRYVTDTLRFFWEFRIPLLQPQSAADVAADELARAMAARRTNSIVDVCSGGGGPVDAIQQRLVDRGVDARFTLTDLFPNVEAYRMLHARNRAIGFISEPVDATNCDLRGMPACVRACVRVCVCVCVCVRARTCALAASSPLTRSFRLQASAPCLPRSTTSSHSLRRVCLPTP
jgi:hypothetical protein